MIQFPIDNLLDEDKCYDFLKNMFHPNGFGCPHGHDLAPTQAPHKQQNRPAVVDYRCHCCGRVFNIFTGTVWSGSWHKCSTIISILRGFAQGIPTLHLSQELGLNYKTLLDKRHQFQYNALENKTKAPLTDQEVETDEMFQNAGEKGTLHPDPDDPPRRRGNKKVGLGTMENDRPPIFGAVGRTTGEIRLEVCDNTRQKTIQPEVEKKTKNRASIYTDDSHAYNKVSASGRYHATVNHSQKEWARDDDGDGIREVHCNTMEGIWTGLRNFLRLFRGVHKKYLKYYVAIFEWAHNLKTVTNNFLKAMMIPASP
jgi:transposase